MILRDLLCFPSLRGQRVVPIQCLLTLRFAIVILFLNTTKEARQDVGFRVRSNGVRLPHEGFEQKGGGSSKSLSGGKTGGFCSLLFQQTRNAQVG